MSPAQISSFLKKLLPDDIEKQISDNKDNKVVGDAVAKHKGTEKYIQPLNASNDNKSSSNSAANFTYQVNVITNFNILGPMMHTLRFPDTCDIILHSHGSISIPKYSNMVIMMQRLLAFIEHN